MTVLVQARRLSGNGGGKTFRKRIQCGINLCVLLEILLASKMSVSCSADLLRRPKRKHAAMACSEMTALNCWPFSILNSCGPASVAFAMWSQNVVMQYIWNQTASHGFERFSVPVYVCVGVCVLFVVLCCVVVFVWWCCGGVLCLCDGVFFCFAVVFLRITEELCKERWQHWCKKISGIKVLPTLLIFTITSNISFIQLPSFNCL